MAVVVHGKTGLLVDTDLCLQEQTFGWATERLTTVMVIGHLERSELVCKRCCEYVIGRVLIPLHRATRSQVTLPVMPPHAPRLDINRQLVFRAILIVHSPDLDLALWNSVVEAGEASL